MNLSHRNSTVDLMRGSAVLLMILFHFCYDLKFFGYVSWEVPDGAYWRPFRYVILSLFLTCVGYGVVQQNRLQINWRRFTGRLLRILLGAVVVTVMSLFLFPTQWIYFGILHFIVLTSLIALPLRNHPRIAGGLGFACLFVGFTYVASRKWPFNLNPLDDYLPAYSVDYVPLLPWTGAVLLGIWLAHNPWFTNGKHAQVDRSGFWRWLSRHSLIIYLLHQPVLFAVLYSHRALIQ